MVIYINYFSFNRIDLPEYNSKEIVREKLLKSLKESGSGFDLS
jgi:E3 ubiquitin-protein ligase HUWE1